MKVACSIVAVATLAAVTLLVWYYHFAVKVNEANVSIDITSKLKRIGDAIRAYNERGTLLENSVSNKAGKPLLSWRVLILPELGENPLYQAFNMEEPWDSARNAKLVDRMPNIYRHPRVSNKSGHTNFIAVKGEDRRIGGTYPIRSEYFMNEVIVVESSDSFLWSKPEEPAELTPRHMQKLGFPTAGGFFGLLGDGSVAYLEKPK